jgi:hypothetical protein
LGCSPTSCLSAQQVYGATPGADQIGLYGIPICRPLAARFVPRRAPPARPHAFGPAHVGQQFFFSFSVFLLLSLFLLFFLFSFSFFVSFSFFGFSFSFRILYFCSNSKIVHILNFIKILKNVHISIFFQTCKLFIFRIFSYMKNVHI